MELPRPKFGFIILSVFILSWSCSGRKEDPAKRPPEPGVPGAMGAQGEGGAGSVARPPDPPPPTPAGKPSVKPPAWEPELVEVPAGFFTMGCVIGRDDVAGGCALGERPFHTVVLNAFRMGRHEVTVSQFRAFVEETKHQTTAERLGACTGLDAAGKPVKLTGASWRAPGFEVGDRHPAACVSWTDAQAYVQWLSGKTGRRFRLPTEAEWEYAARGGDGPGAWAGSKDATGAWANCAGTGCADGFAQAAPVGSHPAGAFGLHDLGGNVWEWTQDAWHNWYAGAPDDGSAWAGDDKKRVLRGGSWQVKPQFLRAARRGKNDPEAVESDIGFRVVEEPGPAPGPAPNGAPGPAPTGAPGPAPTGAPGPAPTGLEVARKARLSRDFAQVLPLFLGIYSGKSARLWTELGFVRKDLGFFHLVPLPREPGDETPRATCDGWWRKETRATPWCRVTDAQDRSFDLEGAPCEQARLQAVPGKHFDKAPEGWHCNEADKPARGYHFSRTFSHLLPNAIAGSCQQCDGGIGLPTRYDNKEFRRVWVLGANLIDLYFMFFEDRWYFLGQDLCGECGT